MKKVLIGLLIVLSFAAVQSQVIVTVGSALLQDPGTDVHIPVTVQGLDATTGGIPVIGIDLHIKYSTGALTYDTTVNFSNLLPAGQWYYGASALEYSANWIEPSLVKLNIPDQTVLFDIVFHYLGSPTELIVDTTLTILLDSANEVIPGVQYVNGIITPSQGSGESRWNGTGSWNTAANWSNGIPGDSTNAIIETGEVTIQSASVAKSMVVNPGTTVIIQPGFSLTVNRNFTNNGSLQMVSDATGTGSFIVRGLADGTGVNTFNRYLAFYNSFPHLVSSPVTNATASVFGSATVETYDESTLGWQQISSSQALTSGTGYRVNGSLPVTISFQGNFPTGDASITNLAYTGSLNPELRGLNLLGNPYPSAIQWEQGTWSRTNLDYAVYVWDGYKFVSWNGSTGALKDGIIPAMQGFFVKSNTAGGALMIPAEARIHNTQPYYKDSEELTNLIDLKIENVSGDGFYDETFVHVKPGSTSGFDGAADAWKLAGNNSYPQIYTLGSDQTRLSINTQPEFTSIPVEFNVGAPGSFKITFSNMETFSPSQPLYFEDKATNTVINIRNTGEFVFTTTGTTEPGRLLLHFSEVGMNEAAEGNFSAWVTGNQLHIVSEERTLTLGSVELFNTMGRLVFSAGPTVTPAAFLLNSELNGIYILRIKTSDGTFTRKLFISRS